MPVSSEGTTSLHRGANERTRQHYQRKRQRSPDSSCAASSSSELHDNADRRARVDYAPELAHTLTTATDA